MYKLCANQYKYPQSLRSIDTKFSFLLSFFFSQNSHSIQPHLSNKNNKYNKTLLLCSVSNVALLRIYFASRLSGAAPRRRRTEVKPSEQLPQGSQYSAGRTRSRVLTASKKTSASSFLMSRWRVRVCVRHNRPVSPRTPRRWW